MKKFEDYTYENITRPYLFNSLILIFLSFLISFYFEHSTIKRNVNNEIKILSHLIATNLKTGNLVDLKKITSKVEELNSLDIAIYNTYGNQVFGNQNIIDKSFSIIDESGRKIGEIYYRYNIFDLISYNSILLYVSVIILIILLLFIIIKSYVSRTLNIINKFKISIDSESLSNNSIDNMYISEFNDAIQMIKSGVKQKLAADKLASIKQGELELNKQLVKITRQVAHDIRSPLESLKMLTEMLDGIGTLEKTIISKSTERISEIANDLLNVGKQQNIKESFNLRILIEELIFEKKFETSKNIMFECDLNYRDSFIFGSEVEIYRALSNLINNSIESYSDDNGDVIVKMQQTEKKICISIQDYGVGIDETLMEKILKGGFSTKKDGNGIGLSSSKLALENNEFKFSIESSIGKGTNISISTQSQRCPDWFCDRLNFNTHNIVCIDDDHSFLELYKNKIDNETINLTYHSSLSSVPISNSTLYLCDYDLNKDITGLDFIISNKIMQNSYIITSMYQDKMIQKRCLTHGVKIIPKQIFSKIDIKYNI